MDTKGFDEKNLAKHKERCDMIEQLAIAEEENRKLGIRADKLEQRLESETRKAERRMRHIDLMGAALTERRNQLHERNERVAELEKQVSDLRAELANAEVPTERERKILDMWPRFDDGEYVWFGDRYEDWDGWKKEVAAVQFERNESSLLDCDGFHTCFSPSERVKRPAPADSWERLEKDALKGVCEYAEAERKPGTIDAHTCCGCRFDEDGDGPTCEKQMALDIIRRAKALAGAEVE